MTTRECRPAEAAPETPAKASETSMPDAGETAPASDSSAVYRPSTVKRSRRTNDQKRGADTTLLKALWIVVPHEDQQRGRAGQGHRDG